MEKKLYSNFRSVKKIEVLKVEVNEGEGTPGDPIARVAYICTLNGRVLFKIGESTERLYAGEDEMIDLDEVEVYTSTPHPQERRNNPHDNQ